MKILDWYVLRRFLVTYFYTVLLIVAVLMVIDYAEKAENFNKQDLTLWRILTEYYLNFIPYYANLLSPLMIFIAAVFTTSKLATHTEIVAMLSSGMSLRRILVPYTIGAVMVGILVFFLIGWVVPNANKVREAFEDAYVRDKFYFNKRNVHLQVAPQIYVYLESYDNISNSGYRFTMERIKDRQLLQKLETPRIYWNKDAKKWSMDSYRLLKFNGEEQEIKAGAKLDTLIPMSPEDFQSKHKFETRLTLTELDAYIAQLRLRGSDGLEIFLIEKYERLAYPFATIILTAMGVIVACRKTRGGMGYQVAIGFVLAFIYIFLIIVARGFAQQGVVPPYIAVWMPNLLFLGIGYVMYWRVPK